MNESAEPQRRRANGNKPPPKKDPDRERHAIDERCEAARRWIGDDDEPAIRGID